MCEFVGVKQGIFYFICWFIY